MSQIGILILGAGQMQVPAIETARNLGWYVIVADGNPRALAANYGNVFEHVDLADPLGMLAMAKTYHQRGLLHGVFTAGTDFSATVAYVAENLGLPGISHEAALNASIKSRMRARFKEHGVPSPAFLELGPGESLLSQDLHLPLVVKPVDSMGARGASKVSKFTELHGAVANARKFSRSGRVIVEEFIEGPEYSIDSLVFDGKLVPCGLARRHIYFPPYFVELGHTLPSELTVEQAKAVEDVLAAAARALGITHGAAKGDIFFTERGPMVGEVAARLSGGYMSGWTFPYASGLDLTQAALLLAIGRRPESLDQPLKLTSAERAIVSIPGIVKEVRAINEARTMPYIRQVFLRTEKGGEVVFPRNNVEKSGNIIAVAPDRPMAEQAAIAAVQRIELILEPLAKTSLDWLAQPCHNPLTVGDRESWPLAYPGLLALAKKITGPEEFVRGQSGAIQVRRISLGELSAERCLWDYRSLQDALDSLESEGRVELVAAPGLGMSFWYALARGGKQAAVFVLDSFQADEKRAREVFVPEHFG